LAKSPEITLPRLSELIKPAAQFESALAQPIKALLMPIYTTLTKPLVDADVAVPETPPTPAELALFIAEQVEEGGFPFGKKEEKTGVPRTGKKEKGAHGIRFQIV